MSIGSGYIGDTGSVPLSPVTTVLKKHSQNITLDLKTSIYAKSTLDCILVVVSKTECEETKVASMRNLPNILKEFGGASAAPEEVIEGKENVVKSEVTGNRQLHATSWDYDNYGRNEAP